MDLAFCDMSKFMLSAYNKSLFTFLYPAYVCNSASWTKHGSPFTYFETILPTVYYVLSWMLRTTCTQLYRPIFCASNIENAKVSALGAQSAMFSCFVTRIYVL